MPRSQASDKCQTVAAKLRLMIADGKLPPGSKLPKWEELEAKFDVSRITISTAMRELQRHGFVRAARRSGTFVADSPPNLSRFGLAFPFRTDQEPWTRFCDSLVNSMPKVAGAGRSVAVYYEANGNPAAPGWQELTRDIRAGVLAGLIVSNYPKILCEDPLLRQLPCVAIRFDPDIHNMPMCLLDNQSFANKAVEYLISRNRKRIAVIGFTGHMVRLFESALKTHNLAVIPYMHIALETPRTTAAQPLASLMMRLPPDLRPDGIVLADDNHVEYGLAGIIDSNAEVSRDLDVVVHCNFPWPVPSILPVKRLGFDAHQVLSTLLEMLESSRLGRKQSTHVIQAKFEDELTQRQPAITAA